MVSATELDVAEQTFVHPSGTRARLLVLRPATGGPMTLFQFVYASCLVAGQAESVPGPHNRWAYAGDAGAAGVVNESLYLVELEGGAQVPLPGDAEDLLETWESR
ncbi:hypothetical protein [Blastococcus xanthinilyticus]|nr:hypothetical protein [Blastococcus xanthinilyticus]